MPKNDIQKQIQKLCAEALEKVREAEKLATEHKLTFSFDVAYGMGGTFYGDETMRDEYKEDGWYASSHSC